MIANGRNHIQEYHIIQWVNGYPSKEVIIEDINADKWYVLLGEKEIVGYFAKLDYDECYDKIEGSWIIEEPYVAIHRTVTKYFNKGLGSKMFDEIKKNINILE